MMPLRSLKMAAMMPALSMSGFGHREKKKKVRRAKFVHHLKRPVDTTGSERANMTPEELKRWDAAMASHDQQIVDDLWAASGQVRPARAEPAERVGAVEEVPFTDGDIR